MESKAADKGESTFAPRSPVELVAPKSTTGASPRHGDDLLPILVSGERGKALRAQLLASWLHRAVAAPHQWVLPSCDLSPSPSS